MFKFLSWVHYTTVIKLHVWWPARLIRRLHFNRCVHFAFQLGRTAEIAHGTATEVAPRRWDYVLIIVMFEVILHSADGCFFHYIALCTFETLIVELPFVLDEHRGLLLLHRMLFLFVHVLTDRLVSDTHVRVLVNARILLNLALLRGRVGGRLKSAARLRICIFATLEYALVHLHGKLHQIRASNVLCFVLSRLFDLIWLHLGDKTVALRLIFVVVVLFVAILEVFVHVGVLDAGSGARPLAAICHAKLLIRHRITTLSIVSTVMTRYSRISWILF